MSTAVRANGVGVRFLFDRDRRVVTRLARLRRRGAEAWGLRDVTLEVGAGEAVALLGRSGAGKTTLLRVIAGVLPADVGDVVVDGRLASLLSVGAGLMAPLTGRENAALLGVLAGLTRRDARRRLESCASEAASARPSSGLCRATRRACAPDWGSPRPTSRTPSCSSSTRCSRRSTTNTARSSRRARRSCSPPAARSSRPATTIRCSSGSARAPSGWTEAASSPTVALQISARYLREAEAADRAAASII